MQDHDMSGMAMGSMDMGDGVPSLSSMQSTYWTFIGAAIAFATLMNVYNKVLCRQRLAAAARQTPEPAKPKNTLPRVFATMTALYRETTYAKLPRCHVWGVPLGFPSLGPALLVAAQVVLVLVLSFYKLDVRDQWSWEDLGYRTGYVTAAQLPLVYILSGKNNLIGLLTGFGYEKLNWLHRWTARVLLLSATIHLVFWFESWARWRYIAVQLGKDPITQRGFAAWCILVWIVLSSSGPLRRVSYEVFVVQHIVTMAGFSAAVYLHLPNDLKLLIWISIAFAIFDRVLRASTVLYNSLSIFHPHAGGNSVWASRAHLEPLSEGYTRVTIQDPAISWRPGQHVLLSCHSVVPLQSHPFTISSLPADKIMQFIIQTRSGGSHRFSKHALKGLQLPVSKASTEIRYSVAVEGPYGRVRPLQQFDTLVFLAGGVGCTFTVPLMRDVVRSWQQASDQRIKPSNFWNKPAAAATRFIHFVWVLKSRDQISWFRSALSQAAEDVATLRARGHDVELEISIYLTCDGWLESKHNHLPCGPTTTSHPQKIPVKNVGKNRELISESVPARSARMTCDSNGLCCCRTIVREGSQDAIAHCTCSQSLSFASRAARQENDQSSSQSSSGNDPASRASLTAPSSGESGAESLHQSIVVQTGRPHTRTIIRTALEQAGGETAVVVCGPTGLVEDVQTSVVCLSDQRAVHKGTGAQGIYLHTEEFCF